VLGGDPATDDKADAMSSKPGDRPAAASPAVSPSTSGAVQQQSAPKLLREVAGLGPKTAGTVPARTTKAVVVRGDGPRSTTATIELYVLDRGAWTKQASWRGHLGARGWTADHREGDLRTPKGTYSLSDAGGRMKDPGTRLPYHRSNRFVPHGSSVFGDSLVGSFDYVIAIDYNRRQGVSPLDGTKPLGAARGGGIWLHVDHDGPTHGCVSVPRDGMKALLRALDPKDHPVVVMGDKASLAV
jgi:L,D-peptidoglycan transpeptidase YkuD (ErfK/YbiS/YcfS/YnhG family)